MPAFAVVKHLDLIEYIVACLIPAAIYLALDPLEFEQLEETLGNCIVMAVTSALMLLTRLLVCRKLCQCELLNWLLWSEWIITSCFGLWRHTAINNTSITRTLTVRGLIDPPMT